MDSQNVLIAGGGIGGLTAALCLARQGIGVTLFEQSAEFGEAGAGIQLSPNASRVLHALGLEAELQAQGFLPAGTQFRHWRGGQVVSESALGAQVVEEYGAPYYHMHRGDLLQVLVKAARAEPLIALHTGAFVKDVEQTTNSVSVRLQKENPAEQLTFEGEALIGADGIHSTVRAALWGDERARFTGNVAWRALVPVDRLPKGLIRPMSTVWWGPGKHFVHYYVRGGTLVNCVCVVEKTGWGVESWTERGELAELKADFSGWNDSIQRLIDNTDANSLYRWALYDRPPMPVWRQGRVSLLGDACHPTLPFMAQGAAMAIEDAAVLAGCMARATRASEGAHSGAIERALQRYEDLRRERTASIQNGSRRNASVFHLSGVKAWFRDRAAARAGKGTMHRLFSYNALTAADG